MKILIDMNLSPDWVLVFGKYSSVIQVRTQDILPATLENIVIPVLRQFESELERGALITIDPSRSRIRILPIIT